jgi:preprotein translocase subunit SecB
MDSGSVGAKFKFTSYKIDSINLKMNPKISYLMDTDPVGQENLRLGIKLRSTEKFSIDGSIQYIGGLSAQIEILDRKSREEMMSGDFGISGIFTPAMPLEGTVEETFAKINIPALLMPYLRAAMTNILSNVGFGTVLFPLVNIYELAKAQNCPVIDRTACKE